MLGASVTLIAKTVPSAEAIAQLEVLAGSAFQARPDCGQGIDGLAEFAGRLCYLSWSLPNPATATNEGYISNIIQQRHFSVLEHSSATFFLEGVSRSLLAELTRHRHLSFSVVSQRFVDADDLGYVLPPAFADLSDDDRDAAVRIWTQAQLGARYAYGELVELLGTYETLSRKQQREAARSVLTNSVDSSLVVTGNLRAWREMLEKRLSPAADAEIRLVAEQILDVLRREAPHSVSDITKAGE